MKDMIIKNDSSHKKRGGGGGGGNYNFYLEHFSK